MKKILLAPAVAVVAGSVALTGTPALAAPPTPQETTNSASEDTNKEAADSAITVEGKDTYTTQELEDGVTLTIKGLKAGQKVTSYFTTESGILAEGTATAEQDGTAKVTVESYNNGKAEPEVYWESPEYNVVVEVDGDRVETEGLTQINVSDAKQSIELSKETVAAKEMMSEETAPVLSGTGLEPNERYSIGFENQENPEELPKIDFATDDEGNFSVPLVVSEEVATKLIGKAKVTVYGLDNPALPSVTLTVTGESEEPSEIPKPTEDPTDAPSDDPSDEAAEYALEVSPKEITPADFVNKDKGVDLTVTGLEPGEEFSYSVVQNADDGLNLERTVKADKNGTWNFTVYGSTTGSDLSGFLGAYEVTVKSDHGELKDSFTVTNTPGKKGDTNDDAEAGDNGSDDSASENSGNNLPRTGMGLAGLIAGGALLTVGATTILVTRRRTK